jgi:hypothetical protein
MTLAMILRAEHSRTARRPISLQNLSARPYAAVESFHGLNSRSPFDIHRECHYLYHSSFARLMAIRDVSVFVNRRSETELLAVVGISALAQQLAARILGLNTSTIHRWLADGFIAGEQVTPAAPWQIRITEELRARVVAEAPPEYLPMLETTMKLGVSRQTVLHRVKRGELQAMLVTQGRRKGLRIKVVDRQSTLFEQLS